MACVEWGCVAREEGEAAQPLKLRMQEDALDEPVAESTPATLLEHEDIGEVGVRREVGDDAGKADLAFAFEETEGDGAGDGAFHDVTWNVSRPVGGGQDAVDGAFSTIYGGATLTYFQVWAYQVARGTVGVGDPIDLTNVGVVLAAAAVLTVVAYWRFNRRDL